MPHSAALPDHIWKPVTSCWISGAYLSTVVLWIFVSVLDLSFYWCSAPILLFSALIRATEMPSMPSFLATGKTSWCQIIHLFVFSISSIGLDIPNITIWSSLSSASCFLCSSSWCFVFSFLQSVHISLLHYPCSKNNVKSNEETDIWNSNPF